MDKAFLKKMKEYLLEQRKTLLASLADQGEDMRNLIKTVESGDEADVAADVIDRTLLNALGAQDANRLQQIDNALDRINQGTYGRCVKCGKEIPQERLEGLPQTPALGGGGQGCKGQRPELTLLGCSSVSGRDGEGPSRQSS
jgi:RNA polymerase-binding transcription factor DksA